MDYFDITKNWTCKLPEGEKGVAKIEKYNVDSHGAFMTSLRGGNLIEGDYTKLMVGGTLMMSDTPEERRTNLPIIHAASGDVLINGLGLGCVLSVLLANPRVTSITVIEKEQDVIDLVGPHFPSVKIICADALEYKPEKGVRFNAVWHDIWAHICGDNLPDMHKLHRKYGRICDWQGSWERDRCERSEREWKKQKAEIDYWNRAREFSSKREKKLASA